MDVLYRLVHSLTKEEIRHFKLSLKRIGTSAERKDEALFDAIRRDKEEADEERIIFALYADGERNAYYRLKNRLTESLLSDLASLHGMKSGESQIYRLLMLAHLFLSRQEYDLCLYCLKRAERMAVRAEQFALLDQVYAGFIRLSNEWMGLNPQTYISLQEKNHPRLEAVRRLEQLIAMLHYRIMRRQYAGKQGKGFLDMVDRTIHEYADSREWNKSATLQLRLFRAVSQLLVQKKEFAELRLFTEKTYTHFTRKNWFDKSRTEEKIRMQIYLVNACFTTSDYSASLKYAETLRQTLDENHRMFYDKYILFYYNALVNNYSSQQPARALEVLDELEKVSRGLKNRFYEHFVLINRATVLYQLKRYNEAIRSLVRCYLQEYYQQADAGFQLKVMVAELMMHYQSGDYGVCQQRCEQVRKMAEKAGTMSTSRNEWKMIQLISDLCLLSAKKAKKSLYNEACRLRDELIDGALNDGESILDYTAWCRQIRMLNT